MRQGVKIYNKIMRQGIILKGIFRAHLKQWIVYTFGKILCDRVYFWGIFYATGYKISRTPLSFPVKYPPPPPGCETIALFFQFLIIFVIYANVLLSHTNYQWRSQVPAFGGQSASVAMKNGGPGASPRGKIWEPRPSDARKTRGTPFSVIFCILNMTTLNTKCRTFC